MTHYTQLVVELTILALAIFLGIEVISKVPTLLHTPLMSGTNAIHGIVIVGAILVAGHEHKDTVTTILGLLAVVLASANVVGGFVVGDVFQVYIPSHTLTSHKLILRLNLNVKRLLFIMEFALHFDIVFFEIELGQKAKCLGELLRRGFGQAGLFFLNTFRSIIYRGIRCALFHHDAIPLWIEESHVSIGPHEGETGAVG